MKPPQCCTMCGHPIHPSKWDLLWMLSPIERRIFDLVQKHGRFGISRDAILSLAWAEDPNGGPTHLATVSVHVANINKKIEEIGLKLKSSLGPHAKYTVEKL